MTGKWMYIRDVSNIENILFGIVLWNSCGICICICIYARCLPSFAAHLRIGRLPKNFQPPQLRLQNMFRSIWPSPVKIYYEETSFSFGKTKKNIQFSLCVYRTISHPETGLSWSHSPQMNCFLFQCKFVIIFPSRVLMDESFDIKETVNLPSILEILLLFHQLRSTATWGRKTSRRVTAGRGHQVLNKQGTHWLQCFLAGSTEKDMSPLSIDV